MKVPEVLGTKFTSSLTQMARAFAFMLAFAPVGICQTAAVPTGELESSETIEEIIVYGDKSMNVLRREVYMAEENLFAVFNSLNGNEDIHVQCHYQVLLASHKKVHVCMTMFRKEHEAAVASAYMAELQGMVAGSAGSYSSRSKVRSNDELMWKELAALASEQPELREAIIKLAKAKQILGSERQRRCEDRIFFCRK